MIRILFSVWLFLWGCHAMAVASTSSVGSTQPTSVLRLDPIARQQEMSGALWLLADPSKALTINDVLKRTAEFQPAQRQDLVRSFNAGAFWLRLALHNPTARDLERWLVVGHPRMQHIEVFIENPERTVWGRLASGTMVPRQQKPLQGLDPVFPLVLPAGQTQQLLVRVESQTAIDMASVLWVPEAYREESGETKLIRVLILGGVLLGALLSLAVFATHREIPYLWLGVLQVSVVLLEATREGFWPMYFWPNHLPFYPQILLIMAGLAIFSMASLVTSSLPAGFFPWHSLRILNSFRWIAGAGVGLGFLHYGWGIRLLSLSAVLLLPASLLVSLIIYRRGYAHARFLGYGLLLTWLLETFRQLANLGLLNAPWAIHLSISAGMLFATPFILMGLVTRSSELAEQLILSQKINQAQSDFLARVNHELRSPLNTIIGFARMLKRGSARLPLPEGLDGIEYNGSRLLGMIDELLDQSRLRAGRLAIKPSPLGLPAWWQQLQSTWGINTSLLGNQLRVEVEGVLPACVLADGDRLRQILDNLLSNANRHTQKGTLTLSVRSELLRDEGAALLHFSVADTGPGIAPELLERIFEPFVRGEPPRNNDPHRRAGFGMGLSISRELAHLMDSEIHVRSELGVGSVFELSLRCLLTDDSANTPAPSLKPEIVLINKPIPPSEKSHALVVDDEPEARLSLVDQLEAQVTLITTASSGQEAVTLLKSRLSSGSDTMQMTGFSVALVDQHMPDGDGWYLLDWLRTHCPGLPVILVSAEEPQPPPEYRATFDYILRKPVSTSSLASALSAVSRPLRPSLDSAKDWSLQLDKLGDLVEGGEVSAIDDWCTEMRADFPDHLEQIKHIQQAAYRLDFDTLRDTLRTLGSKEHDESI